MKVCMTGDGEVPESSGRWSKVLRLVSEKLG